MNANSIRSHKGLALILGVALLLVLLAVLLIPGGSAKYRTQVVQANALHNSDSLATSFTLTGSAENTLLPGTTDTFAPVITITGKTEIPAFLYLELLGPEDAELDEAWTKLEGVVGKNGGQVYAYQDGAALTDADADDDGKLTITPVITLTWSRIPAENTVNSVQAYAYMIQQTDATIAAADAFTEAVPQTEP